MSLNDKIFHQSSDNLSCSLSDLMHVWDTKEYRIFPTPILDQLTYGDRINFAEIHCYKHLVKLAWFKKNMSVTITRREMAGYLDRSKRSVSRYLSKLQRCGYIKRIEERGEVATIEVRFPKELTRDILLNTKDRKKVNQAESAQKLPRKDALPETNLSRGVAIVGNHSFNNNNNNTEVNKTVDGPVIEKANKKTNSQDIITCNVEAINQKVDSLNKKLRSASSKSEKYDLMKKMGCLEATLTRSVNQHQKQATESRRNLQQAQNIKQLTVDPMFIKNCLGERTMNQDQHVHLKRSLMRLGYQGDCLNKLINEITYEVRFGSLRMSRESKSASTINHALNIAVKLVREKRWEKPSGINLFLSKNTDNKRDHNHVMH